MALIDEVKNELAAINDGSPSAKRAQATAMIRFGGTIHLVRNQAVVECTFDSHAAASWLRQALKEVYGRDAELYRIDSNTANGEVTRHVVRVFKNGSGNALLRQTGLLDLRTSRITRGLPPNIIGNNDIAAIKAVWRGAFLARGELSDPGKAGYLEVACPMSETALALVGMARRLGVQVKTRQVRNTERVVLNDAFAIERLLTNMGAVHTAREWSGKRNDGESRGKANRLANFDDANMRRSAKAAVEACAKVQHAFKILGDDIPENLRAAGQLRLDHRDATLEGLGRLADPPITKDAIAGRIRRLLQLAAKVERQRAEQGDVPHTHQEPHVESVQASNTSTHAMNAHGVSAQTERITMKTLKDLGDLKGKRVLVRADFNVPLDGTTITDDGRIRAALPTITTLRNEGAKVIVMAHLGRPKGKVVPELSLAPVAARLGELLGITVPLAADTYGEDAQAKVAAMSDGDVVLLENVRFNPEETSKDEAERAAYAKKIADLGDAFVSDGFGVVHRAQGSNYDVAADLPAAAGLLVEKEVTALSKATVNPERPLTVVLGGSKVSDKLGVIENLLGKANRLVIGGGMVYTFLKAQGYEVGTSLLEEDQLDKVKSYIETAKANGVELVLPTDVVVNAGFPAGDTPINPEVVPADAIPADRMGLDIGPESQKLFHDAIVNSKTVVWNGPMGVFEVPEFAAGTRAVAQGLVDATAAGAFTIVGGGDSASAVRNLGFPEDGFSHISTGGGASLEFLEGKTLPGLSVLE
ncbi:hypothetical protein GCM10007377_05960 [Galliscardovia ingluviei]|uniref:Multifunctional fusion protein n=2 Tax=Galliscardovia ingluviei TaxID=1769422 RepID=A0A8J3AFN8_9BIFI|nr:hypothetical protein GCM10007377_05960 [Galliscardovia ingluviei]